MQPEHGASEQIIVLFHAPKRHFTDGHGGTVMNSSIHALDAHLQSIATQNSGESSSSIKGFDKGKSESAVPYTANARVDVPHRMHREDMLHESEKRRILSQDTLITDNKMDSAEDTAEQTTHLQQDAAEEQVFEQAYRPNAEQPDIAQMRAELSVLQQMAQSFFQDMFDGTQKQTQQQILKSETNREKRVAPADKATLPPQLVKVTPKDSTGPA